MTSDDIRMSCFDSLHSTESQMNIEMRSRSVLVAEWLALLTLEHEVPGSSPAGDGFQLMTAWLFIAQSLSSSPIISI